MDIKVSDFELDDNGKVAWNSIPRFTRSARYQVDIPWSMLEEKLADWADNGLFDLDIDPDFQRGHVWTPQQQSRYVEYVLRGGKSSRELHWNHPNWTTSFKGTMTLVDGKQRLEAVLKFLRDELVVFGGFSLSNFEDRRVPFECAFKFNVNDLKTRTELLQWYIDLNAGGVAHTTEEIEKVRAMLAEEQS